MGDQFRFPGIAGELFLSGDLRKYRAVSDSDVIRRDFS
jgi:hypothetical protein